MIGKMFLHIGKHPSNAKRWKKMESSISFHNFLLHIFSLKAK